MPKREAGTEASSSPTPTLITQLAGRPDFPQCALGELIDIRGYTGVVVGIVHNSIKVRSPDGTTQSFNFHRLRTLYAPVVHPEPAPGSHGSERPGTTEEPAEPAPAAPKRDFIAEPDFAAPLRSIKDLVGRADFPSCAYGQHVDIAGFRGVVVEIVKQSLKVRTPEGTTRSYNAAGLRNLYGQP